MNKGQYTKGTIKYHRNGKNRKKGDNFKLGDTYIYVYIRRCYEMYLH